MNLKPKHSLSKIRSCRLLSVGLLCAAWLTARIELSAQEALAPVPQYSITPPAMLPYTTNELQVFSSDNSIPPLEQKPLAQWGPVSVRPHVFYRFLYGDSIPSTTTNFVSTSIQQISPGIFLGLGNHWSLDYTPTLNYYSSSAFRDTLDHYVRLTGGTAYKDWVLGLSQSYQSSSPPLVETGQQTEQQTFTTALTGTDQINTRMALDLALGLNIVDTDQFTSYKEWSTLNWLHYQFWPRVDTSLGLGVGYVTPNQGSDMLWERFLGRIGFRPANKISFEVHGGLETRQFLSGGDANLVNPLVGGLIQYQPFEVTRLSITVDRTVAASYFQNQITETFEVVGGVNQRLIKILYLNLSGGYHHVEYVASTGAGTGRIDDYYTFDARLTTTFWKDRGSAALFYQYSDNSSTEPGFTYNSNQVGFELGYRW
jgi:hypothetical protein